MNQWYSRAADPTRVNLHHSPFQPLLHARRHLPQYRGMGDCRSSPFVNVNRKATHQNESLARSSRPAGLTGVRIGRDKLSASEFGEIALWKFYVPP